ncbi:hypothetical protein AUQ42_12515 [Thalassospira sp. MCCC 1A02491]|nr:hypothetical protein AUQ42_12515 [Thalassospira sp. MCCC 1A02491]
MIMAPSSIRKMTACGADLVFIVNAPPCGRSGSGNETGCFDRPAAQTVGLMIKHLQDPRTVPAQPGLHIIYGMVIAKTQIGAVVLPSQGQSQSQSPKFRAPS